MRTSSEIQAVLAKRYPFAQVNVRDSQYSIISTDWVTQELATALRDTLWSLNLFQWMKDKFDCDKFSHMSRWLADTAMILTRVRQAEGKLDTSISLGILDYMPDNSFGGHEVVTFISAPKGELEVMVWEPQSVLNLGSTDTGLRVLSESENNSAVTVDM